MDKKQVITVTLNPSLDRTIVTHYLSLGYHNHVSEATRLHPGGRGVNIARALHTLDVPAHAVITLGDDPNGAAYRTLLMQEPLPVTFVVSKGTTRSNVTILDTGNQQETHLIEKSTWLTAAVLDDVVQTVSVQAQEGDFVVFAGSLPDGVPDDTFGQMIPRVREKGVEVVLSATLEAMGPGIDARPDLLVLNQTELEAYFNHPVRSDDDILYCANKLLEMSIQQVLVIQTDGRAILTEREQTWALSYSEDALGTHSGVKEAVLAGYLAGRARGLSVPEALDLGGAAAVYASGQIGSDFGTLEEIQALRGMVDVSSDDEDDDDSTEDVM
jgi:1-phosphofructokinase